MWTTDLDSMFQQFLATAVVTSEGGGKLPDLAKFNEQISKYRRVQEEVGQLRTPTDIGWLRVNSQPIKQAMSTWATKWVFMFTQYLHNHVLEKLQVRGLCLRRGRCCAMLRFAALCTAMRACRCVLTIARGAGGGRRCTTLSRA